MSQRAVKPKTSNQPTCPWSCCHRPFILALVLGKLPVPGRPTIWMIVWQGPIALAVGAGGGCLDIFTLICPFSSLSPSLWETARYRLKYCLKGPLNPKQATNKAVPGAAVIVRLFLLFGRRSSFPPVCSLIRWQEMVVCEAVQ